MTKQEFLDRYVLPIAKENDSPTVNRQLFNDVKSAFHKNGYITDRQVYNWTCPATKLFT